MESKKYNVAFKMECIGMVEEDGLRWIDISRKLGTHEKTIYRWLAEYRKDGKKFFPVKDVCVQKMKNCAV